MYKISLTAQANEDLEQIIFYIARSLDNPEAAATFMGKVIDCYSQLERNPLIYQLCSNGQLTKFIYRKVVIGKYIMVYRIAENSKMVYVLRFFYGAKNYEKFI